MIGLIFVNPTQAGLIPVGTGWLLNPGFETSTANPPANWCIGITCDTTSTSLQTSGGFEGNQFYRMGTSAGCCIPIIQQKKISNSPSLDTPSFTFSFRVNALGGSGTYRSHVTIVWCEDTGGSCLFEDDTIIEIACSATCSSNTTTTHDIQVPGAFNVISQGWNKVTYPTILDQENSYFGGRIAEFFAVTLRTWGTAQVDFDYVQFGATQLISPQGTSGGVSPYGPNPVTYPCCGPVTQGALQGASLRAPDIDSLPFIYLFIVLFLLTLGPYFVFRRERKNRQYEIRV